MSAQQIEECRLPGEVAGINRVTWDAEQRLVAQELGVVIPARAGKFRRYAIQVGERLANAGGLISGQDVRH